MATPIDFYFDFSSPYGYFGSELIDAIGDKHQRAVIWRPYLMGAALKLTGRKPLVFQDLVKDYALIDLPRTARLHDITYNLPENFPVQTVAAGRAYYWLFEQNQDRAKTFAKTIYRTYFIAGKDISKPETVLDTAASIGVDHAALEQALQDQVVKDRLRRETDAAIARKVFGSPFFVVDDQPFWGVDHLDQLDRWLTKPW